MLYEGQIPIPADELGLSKQQFRNAEKQLRLYVDGLIGKERNRDHYEYYIFHSPQEKQIALEKMAEAQQEDEAFRYLQSDWGDDPQHPAEGLVFHFSKSEQDSEKKILDFFARYNIFPRRIHHIDADLNETGVLAEDPQSEKKDISSGAKLISFEQYKAEITRRNNTRPENPEIISRHAA